jgi:Zn-dependent protease with chaperone function
VSEARASAAEEISRLTSPFEQPIEPVRVSILYRLALFLVAAAMVLLPLIYLALIVLVGWGLFWHAAENVTIFKAMSGGRGSIQVATFAYLTPLIVGSILLLFMIKPIFARRPKPPEPVALDPVQQPTLFAFVERLCAAVGAAKPERIHVDHQVNASAGFRRGMWSLATNELVLTIGLPLVAGMTLRQLAGVLAHEFGHFAQGTGMRLTYVIRAVNHWFARVVYERDAWDIRLDRWSKGTDWRLMIVLNIARVFVWLTRRLLWALMMAGHAISCLMLRQMEFDADRYEARVAGSEAFEGTVFRLQELNAASQQAFGTLGSSWHAGQLADDLPALIQANAERLPSEVGQEIQEHVRVARTGVLDTHPADGDRIESARREASTGVFHLQDPGTILLRDFDGLSRQVTMAFYAHELGRQVPASNLVPTATMVQGEQDLQAAVEILNRYFKGAIPSSPPLGLPPDTSLDPPEDMRTAYRVLQESRRLVEAGAEKALQRRRRYHKLNQTAVKAAQALHLLAAGYQIDAREFGLTVATSAEAKNVLEHALSERLELREQGAEHVANIQRRLTLALRLIHHPQAWERIADSDAVLAEARRLVTVLVCLRSDLDVLAELHRTFAAFSLLIKVTKNEGGTEKAIDRIRSLAEDLVLQLERLRDGCDAPYPFEDREGVKTIGTYAVEDVPSNQEFGAVHSRAFEAITRINSLYTKALGSLVGSAARIESALGLPPLPVMPDDPVSQAD